MRHHFDYKKFRDGPGFSDVISQHLEYESYKVEDFWTFGGRWNPIRLPSETHASILRLSVDSERLSVCCRGDVGRFSFYQMSGEVKGITPETVIALVRSKAVYQEPLTSMWYSCSIDLFFSTIDTSSTKHKLPSDSSEFSSCIVHFYARLLVLRCYEDYHLRHNPEPVIDLDSNRTYNKGRPCIVAIHRRRLELVQFKQDLSGYLGPLAPEHKGSDSADDQYRRRLQSLLTDIEMLLSLYDNAVRIYEWHRH